MDVLLGSMVRKLKGTHWPPCNQPQAEIVQLRRKAQGNNRQEFEQVKFVSMSSELEEDTFYTKFIQICLIGLFHVLRSICR